MSKFLISFSCFLSGLFCFLQTVSADEYFIVKPSVSCIAVLEKEFRELFRLEDKQVAFRKNSPAVQEKFKFGFHYFAELKGQNDLGSIHQKTPNDELILVIPDKDLPCRAHVSVASKDVFAAIQTEKQLQNELISVGDPFLDLEARPKDYLAFAKQLIAKDSFLHRKVVGEKLHFLASFIINRDYPAFANSKNDVAWVLEYLDWNYMADRRIAELYISLHGLPDDVKTRGVIRNFNSLKFSFNSYSTLAIIYLGIFPTAIAFQFRYYITKTSGPVFLSYVAYLIPAFAVIWGYILLSEKIGLNSLIGIIISAN